MHLAQWFDDGLVIGRAPPIVRSERVRASAPDYGRCCPGKLPVAFDVCHIPARSILIRNPVSYTDEMRSIGFLLTLSIAVPASAEPLQIHGMTGYVSEYELSGSVSERDLNGKKEFSGPLTVTHVGLCTHDGPKESVGEIRFELARSSSRITATLDFDGNKCTYKGMLSESYQGFMDCGRQGSLPLRLWTK